MLARGTREDIAPDNGAIVFARILDKAIVRCNCVTYGRPSPSPLSLSLFLKISEMETYAFEPTARRHLNITVGQDARKLGEVEPCEKEWQNAEREQLPRPGRRKVRSGLVKTRRGQPWRASYETSGLSEVKRPDEARIALAYFRNSFNRVSQFTRGYTAGSSFSSIAFMHANSIRTNQRLAQKTRLVDSEFFQFHLQNA